MLNRNTSVSVNAAWPAAKEIAAGATPASRIATGSRNHSSVVLVPIAVSISAPTMKPITVPDRPRSAVCPVLSAFERSTESAPRTTQKEC